MKRLVFTILFSVNIIVSSGAWYPQAPVFGINILNDIQFNGTNGIIVGQWGSVFISSDSGNTWFPIQKITNYNLLNISFIDSSIFVCGENGTVLKSLNHGITWQNISLGSSVVKLNSIDFVNKDTGWVAGEGGSLYKTLNGGTSWQKISNSGVNADEVIYVNFFDFWNGLVVSRYGKTYKTSNNGSSWSLYTTTIESLITGYSHAAAFFDKSTGVIDAGNSDGVYILFPALHSIRDSSKKGHFEFPDFNNYANSLKFQGRTMVYGITNHNDFFISADTGRTWTIKNNIASTPRIINSFFYSNGKGYIIGDSGLCLQTSNGGNSWTKVNTGFQFNPTNYYEWYFQDMFWKDQKNAMGLIVGVLHKSSDGGKTWQRKDTFSGYSKHFALGSPNKMYVLSSDGYVYRSSDTGTTWQKQLTCPCSTVAAPVYDYRFFDENGYLLCGDGKYYRTTDGGSAWTRVSGAPDSCLMVAPLNNSVVYSITRRYDGYRLHKSLNGFASYGTNNLTAGSFPEAEIISLIALSDTSLIIGTKANKSILSGQKVFRFYKSTNSGQTWIELSTGGPLIYTDLNNIVFYPKIYSPDRMHIWIYGHSYVYENLMYVMYSPDAGNTWYKEYPGMNAFPAGVYSFGGPNAYLQSFRHTLYRTDNYGKSVLAPSTGAISNQLTFSKISTNTFRVHWNKKNCDKYLLMLCVGEPVKGKPMHSTEYGEGDELGNASFCVYSGVDTSVSVYVGSTPDTTFYLSLFEYNGNGQSALYDDASVSTASCKTFNGIVTDTLLKTTFCAGDSMVINFTTDIPATDTVNYILLLSSKNGAFLSPETLGVINNTILQTGQFRVRLSNNNPQGINYRIKVDMVTKELGLVGGKVSQQTLSISPFPKVTIYSPDTSKCYENAVFSLTDTSTNAFPVSRLWRFPDQTTTINKSITWIDSTVGSREIMLILTSAGCSDSVSKQLVSYGAVKPALNSPVICGNTKPILKDTVPDASLFKYVWYKDGMQLNGSSASIEADLPGTYHCKKMDNLNSCATISDSIRISAFHRPGVSMSLLGLDIFCDGDSTLLKASSDTICIYEWFQNDVSVAQSLNDTFIARQGGYFKVKALNSSMPSCTSGFSLIKNIYMNPSPPKPTIIQNGAKLESSVNSINYYYRWYLNDTILQGQYYYDVTPNRSGAYKVELSNVYNCNKTSAPLNFVYSPSSLSEVGRYNRVSIYPNPVLQDLIIEGGNVSDIRVYDLSGRILITQRSRSLDKELLNLRNLAPGTYFLEIVDESGFSRIWPICKL